MTEMLISVAFLVWSGFLIAAVWKVFTTPTEYDMWLKEQETDDE